VAYLNVRHHSSAMNLFGSIACLLVGAMLLTYAAIHFARFASCRRFPVAGGQVLTKTIVATSGSPGFGGGYVPKISYSYTVATKRYTAYEIYSICGSSLATEAKAEQFCSELIAEPFKVFFNPAKPTDAFLRNGPPVAIILPLCIGVIFTIYGVVLLCHT